MCSGRARFREGTGFREPGPCFDGSDRFCVPKVPGSVSWKPGSGPRFRVQKVACPRVRRFRCSMGSDGLGSVPEVWTEPGSGNRVPETRCIKKVPGSGDSIPKVPKVTFYFESMLLYFESILYTCARKVHFCTLKVYFGTLKVYFCTWKV